MTLPKLEIGYGLGKGRNSFAIGAASATQAMSGIKECPLAAVLVFASVRYDLEALLNGVHGVVGDVPLIGATTAGEICNEPQHESVVVVALASPYLKVRVGLVQGVSRNWRQAVTQAVSSAEIEPFFSPQSLIWQELALQGKSAFAMLFSPGNTKAADSLSFEILEELTHLSRGLLPILGGGAADDWRMEANYTLWEQRAYVDSVLVAVFETQLRFGIAMAHGYHPSSHMAIVTRSHNHEVLEITGEPAAEAYSRLHDSSWEALKGKHLTLTTQRPMGMPDPYGQYRLNVASFFTAEGGVRFAQPTPEGTILTVMETNLDSQVAAGPEALRKALLRGAVTDPAMALVFSCALRGRILGKRVGEEIDGIKDLIPGVPVVGFYSFGEQGQSDYGVNRHNNVVIAVLTLGREFSFGAQVALKNEQLRLKLEQQTADLMVANDKLLHEIGERHRAEEALRESEGFLNNIFASIQDGISVLDRDFKIFRINLAMEQNYAQSMPLLGKKCYTAYHGRSEPCEICPTRRTYETKEAAHEVVLERGANDEILRHVDLFTFPLLDPFSGQMTGVVEYVRDITRQKLEEEAGLETQRKYRLLAENVIDVIWTMDLNFKLTYASPSCESLSGYKDKEIVGMNLELLLTPDSMDLCKKTLAELFSPENLARHEYPNFFLPQIELRHKDGSRIVYIEVKGSFLKNSQGQPGEVVGVARDITERKQLEEQFLQAQKMEAVGTLAGGIAHDFNNILTAILGNIGLAMLDGKIGPKGQDRLIKAEQACLRAQALSQQLLTFAKGGTPVKKLFSVEEFLSESLAFTCVGSPVRCETTFPQNLWSIEADIGQIGQVFQNITINALQAMPTGGTIKVWAENLTIGTDSDLPLSAGKYIKVSVRDQGMGIPTKHLPRIFDPYFTTKQKGSGLGLASAYAIVKKHHGHIAVESKPEVGTTFHIYLPAVERQAIPQPEEDRGLPMGKGKILVMDDDEMVREVLGGMLASLGYEPEFAKDGNEAIEMSVRAQGSGLPFAAAILDLTVPGGMGGKETIARLLEIAPQIKAVVSSGYSDDPIMADFQKYGFNGVISKPYKISELWKVLNKALAGKE